MTNLFPESFGYYGTGASAGVVAATQVALLSGTYAQVDSGFAGIVNLPWDATNSDLYYSSTGTTSAGTQSLRYVLETPKDTLIVSEYFAVSALPSSAAYGICGFADGSNNIIAGLWVTSTGAIQVQDSAGVVLSSTDGPVIVAQTATHLEFKITASTGAVHLNVNETTVLNVTGLVFTNVGNIAQVRFHDKSHSAPDILRYTSNIIIRDTTGSVNNDITGDRRVATLVVNADDVAHQGWTAQPRHRFDAGILDNRAANNTGVSANSTADTDLGAGDFTIEGSLRWFALPSGSTKAVIFGKWDEGSNRRSYQFYTGGPSLESGNTVFRVSTDGTAGTVSEIFSWPWAPETDRWYHVAVCRSSGEVLFFIDGVQQGVPFTDANTYFAGAEPTSIGAQVESGFDNVAANTSFDGFMDEVRLTVGVARYTSDFAPPTDAFPRGGSDPDWADVVLLCGFDTGIFDESSFARTLNALNGTVAITPDDGAFNFQVLNKAAPFDDTFIEAALIPATGILTQTAVPTNNKIVTVGTTDGSTPAVYTWKTALTGSAFEVKIAATADLSLNNLTSAINASSGAGTTYGTGTTANFDVSASRLPIEQLQVEANTPGTGGNAIVSTTNDTNASWAHATLTGGVDIPGYSQFSLSKLPNQTTIVDSLTLVGRRFKTDAGTCNVQAAFVGSGGAAAQGADRPITTVPTYYRDTFEADPDTSDPLTPTTVISGKVRENRTV